MTNLDRFCAHVSPQRLPATSPRNVYPLYRGFFMHLHETCISPSELTGRIHFSFSPVSFGILNAENLQ